MEEFFTFYVSLYSMVSKEATSDNENFETKSCIIHRSYTILSTLTNIVLEDQDQIVELKSHLTSLLFSLWILMNSLLLIQHLQQIVALPRRLLDRQYL